MFKMVTRILGVIALTGWMGAANATLIFDFSWDADGVVITGEIYGLSDDGNAQSASGIVLTSVGGSSVLIDIDLDIINWSAVDNTFSVLDGEIVSWDFITTGFVPNGVVDFMMWHDYALLYYEDIVYEGSIESSAFINRVTVPEPSSVILMLLGLAGLSFARYRKQY